MKIFIRVTAQDLLDAGAPLNVIRQSYRKQAGFEEFVEVKEPVSGVQDAKVAYKATGSSRDLTYYFLPAMSDDNGTAAETVPAKATYTVVYGGSIKDSYVKVTA